MTKLLLFFAVLPLMLFCQIKKNPYYICKECGTFDLSKMTFSEDMDKLASKTGIYKSALVNADYELKQAVEISKNDEVHLDKFRFEDQRGEILVKKPSK